MSSLIATAPPPAQRSTAPLAPPSWSTGPTAPRADRTIGDLILDRCWTEAERIAVEHEGRRITYAELDRRSAALAKRLRLEGVGAGGLVGVFTTRSIEMVVGFVAVLRLGAAYIPQDVRIAPREQLEHIVRMTGMQAVVTTAEHSAIAGVVAPAGLVFVDAADPVGAPSTARPPASGRGAAISGQAPPGACAVIFTSGTTGTPNGVAVTDENLVNLLTASPGDLGIVPGTRVAQLLNIGFDMAAWEILGTLVNGGTLVIRGSDIAATAGRVDVLVATPSILATLSPEQCQARTVAVAGERCPQTLADAWSMSRTFYNGCGPTEVTIVNTMSRHRTGRPVTIGVPIPNTSVYVLDDELRPVATGAAGEMWVGGAGVTAGYLGNPSVTAERYRPDPFGPPGGVMFRTRDVGRWTDQGELEHLSRTDDQVKVRGFRVELDSVSRAIERVTGCELAVAVQLDGRTLGAVTSGLAVAAETVRQDLAAALPYYAIPETIIAVDEIPLTGRGKVDRRAVTELLVHGRAAAGDAR